jgi:hypothetical protein
MPSDLTQASPHCHWTETDVPDLHGRTAVVTRGQHRPWL